MCIYTYMCIYRDILHVYISIEIEKEKQLMR